MTAHRFAHDLSDRLTLPEELRGVFFDFLWDTRQCWVLPTETSIISFDELAWHLDLPVWTTVPGDPRFDLAPSAVLKEPERFPARWERIRTADLAYPLEMFRNDRGVWVILDGYHRLARHRLEGSPHVAVRLHHEHYKSRILRHKKGNRWPGPRFLK
jgi:hypothetical protein